MTREEAIEVLKERYLTCVGIGLDNHAHRVNEALNMAIEALQREEAEEMGYCHRIKPKEYLSADAVPTVIRSKTLLPTKDFKEWAKRIKEVNPNAVVIPCDAEVVSADAVPHKVIAEVKVDTDEIIKRIKEEYVFADEVVRCKDCKYSFYDKDYESYNCRKHEYVECFDADDYCSWGERND